MAEISMETCLLDMPYEVLFEIFRTLSKDKLIKISRLCSKFRDVAGDTRLWKNVHIKYRTRKEPWSKPWYRLLAFEDIYSEPWPVKAINLSSTKIKPPVFSQTEQIIKVARLNLSTIIADEVTIAAILAKYQCTELNLDGDSLGIEPEAFSKQTAVEVLKVTGRKKSRHCSLEDYLYSYTRMSPQEIHQFLAPILRYFNNLKTLDMSYVSKRIDFHVPSFVKSLPTSLEKLFLGRGSPDDAFFKLLAERTPNLKEFGVLAPLCVKNKSLLGFQFLETLYFMDGQDNSISDLYNYLTKFPALKTVNLKTIPEDLQKMLQPHGIIVGKFRNFPEWPVNSKYEYLWCPS